MKRLILFAIFTIIAITAGAQNRSKVIFYLLDEESKQPLQGAVVEVAPKEEPTDKSYYTTGREGYMEFSVPMGEYVVTATFIGYADKTFACNANAKVVELGKIYMRESATKIDAVVKEVHQFRTTQNADTLIYNASAFKTTKDAEAEKLLSKMPGVVVEDGQVEVQGEQIKKVFVDGDEFFGDDVTMAIKNIPAEIVDKVEVFDKLSDEAEFAGIDDGESYKALNFVTKKSMRNGQFGKVYAGVGWQPETDKVSFNPKYLAGGNINSFRNKQKITVLGLFNNINQQNFSFEDLLGVNSSGKGGRGNGNQFMVRPQAGVALVNAVGVNYSDTWGRRKQVKFQGSYFFNNTNTQNLSERTTWYEYPAPYGTQYSLAESQKINNNHRLNARIDWKISRNMQLTSRTTLSYQGHRPTTTTEPAKPVPTTTAQKPVSTSMSTAKPAPTTTEQKPVSTSMSTAKPAPMTTAQKPVSTSMSTVPPAPMTTAQKPVSTSMSTAKPAPTTTAQKPVSTSMSTAKPAPMTTAMATAAPVTITATVAAVMLRCW